MKMKAMQKSAVQNHDTKRVVNFNPGPAKLPESVMRQAQAEFLNYDGLGISVMEMSHRSTEFMNIMSETKNTLIRLLNIPDNYKIMFLQGGATGQFSALPLNLIRRSPNSSADYIVTGTWSAKAVKEAEKYGNINVVHPKLKKYSRIPDETEWNLDPEAAYVYYCDNETANGVEFPFVPETGNVPLIADMSSNILSRPFDITKFGAIIAGAQKNIGCAGVTLVIIREDLIGYSMKECPVVLDYKTQIGMNSLYNTPPSYSIYLMGLVLDWIQQNGGVMGMAKKCVQKSQLIYTTIAESDGFYSCLVESGARSRMNVTFRIGGPGGDEALEKEFVEEAKKANMLGIKGHRSVGGIRVSLYNAVTVEEVQSLVRLMESFRQARQ
uniref:Phosphoserine aminotransferase n=1 Tax=Phallusia mammillata TaxID=59560 RepID=A0A6F9DRR3_9ASCI|nr:phosphoserine aminotransferase-like [Phallusia mammillata]